MEKKFHIYDDQGNPSSQGFTADEIKGKGLNPNTIVCPEFGQPCKLGDFQELAGWAPPKLDEKKRKSILSGKARNYVMAAALAVTGGGGAYYVHEKQSEKAVEISQCLKNKRKNEISLGEARQKISDLQGEIKSSKENIKNYEKQIVENKNQAISLSNNIPRIENEIQQATSARDKAQREICTWLEGQTCIDRRTATVNLYNSSINTNISTVASYKSEIQQIEQIVNPKLSDNINEEKENIKSKEKEIEDLQIIAQELTTKSAIDCGHTETQNE